MFKVFDDNPSGIAGWRGAEAVTLAALAARTRAWRALALRTPGQACALYLADSLEFGAALLGCWQAGKTVWLTADTLPASCTAMAPHVAAFFGEFGPRHAPQAPAPDDACALPWLTLEPNAPALVVHTSGSTGTPQAIPKRLGQLLAEVDTLEAVFGADIGDASVVSTVSHQHIYGLLFKVLWPLRTGRPVEAQACVYPEQLLDVLARRPSILVGSPAHLKRLPEHLDWNRARLRAVFSSGGPLAPEAGASCARLLGQVPAEVYGSSETGGIAWRRRHAGATGNWQPLPGVEWRAADDGRLEVRSPHLPDDGWFTCADRIGAAGDGRFVLLGRGDRLVKIEEKRISLDAIEAALVATGLAAEARVIVSQGQDGARQALAAFVVPSAAGAALLAGGKRAMNERLRAALAEVVENVALPRRWRYMDALPVNAQGKTTQAMLLALLEGEARPRVPYVSVLEQSDARVLLELSVPPSLLYFDGHFPQAPILPGVVQVDWAILYGRQYFALPNAFKGINALKFQQVIAPSAVVQLELQHEPQAGSLQFRYFSEAGQHAGGRILFS